MIPYLLTFVIGAAVGALIHAKWDDIPDVLGAIRDRLPDGETMSTENLPKIRRALLIWGPALLLVCGFVGILVWNASRPDPLPTIKLGVPTVIETSCKDVSESVVITMEDVRRGSIIIGVNSSTDEEDCRRVIPLYLPQPTPITSGR